MERKRKGISFSYSSGMGGWAMTLEISEDGSFHGEYCDEDYSENSNGNITLNQYQCTFSGIFSTPEKISDWEYVMYLLNIETEEEPEEEPGTELFEPMDNFEYGNNWIKHVYTEPYGLENAYEIRIYCRRRLFRICLRNLSPLSKKTPTSKVVG